MCYAVFCVAYKLVVLLWRLDGWLFGGIGLAVSGLSLGGLTVGGWRLDGWRLDGWRLGGLMVGGLTVGYLWVSAWRSAVGCVIYALLQQYVE